MTVRAKYGKREFQVKWDEFAKLFLSRTTLDTVEVFEVTGNPSESCVANQLVGGI